MPDYTVAGLSFCIDNEEFESFFYQNYRHFQVETTEGSPFLFKMNFKPVPAASGEPDCRFRSDRGIYRIWLGDGAYTVEFCMNGQSRSYRMRADENWTQVDTDIYLNGLYDPLVLNELIMVAYIYSASFHNAVLLHASCIRYKDEGVAFVGPSGIGKSTHSLLWLEHIRGACLLNDDQPVARVMGGIPYIFGTPWSGKAFCFKNECARLNALFLMAQAPENRVEQVRPVQAFKELLASCSMIKEEKRTFACITETLASIAGKVKVFRLGSKPGKEAAQLAFEYGISKK